MIPSLRPLAAGLLMLGLGVPAVSQAAVDTTRVTESRERPGKGHSPRGAVLRSALVPGLGQIYNRQAIKAPIVWAALGGIGWWTGVSQSRLVQGREAFWYAQYVAAEMEPDPAWEPAWQALGSSTNTSLLEDNRNILRRNRDLTFLAFGVAYFINVIDAFIAGHLYDFDVSPDLAGGPAGYQPVLTLRLAF